MLRSISVPRSVPAVLALALFACATDRAGPAPAGPGTAAPVPAETAPADPVPAQTAEPARAAAPLARPSPLLPEEPNELFTRLRLEVIGAWREGDSVVLRIQEERDESATEVLSSFDGWVVGDEVILTPRYGEGVSGRRRHFRVRLPAEELAEDWRERVWLVVTDDLRPIPSGAEPTDAMLRQRVVLGARVLR